MKYKIDIDNVYFQNTPKKILEILRDEEIDEDNVGECIGWVDDDEVNEEYVDIQSEFEGGCIQLWGIPLRLLIELK